MTALDQDARAAARPCSLTTAATALVLVGVLAVAWSSTAGQSHAMSSMVQGLAQVGRAMTFDMSAPAFIGMWAAMMAAMMLPAVAPLVLEYGSWRAPLAATSARVVFAAGYLAVWTLTGVVALVALRAMNGGHAGPWLDRVGGTLLVVAGAYQFAPSKQHAIAAYRRMLRARVTSSGGGAVAAARAGLDQGMCCLACCGALMAVLLAVGIMNLAWMAALTAVCFAEKNSRHGGVVTTTTGLALLALGAAVLLHPQLLTTLAPSPMAMGPMTR
jgi:predicted metal-binding membrane protein